VRTKAWAEKLGNAPDEDLSERWSRIKVMMVAACRFSLNAAGLPTQLLED